jgi:chemotaxis protein CheX
VAPSAFRNPDGSPRDITGLIGLSGPARGTVAVSFPVKTALAVSNRFLGTETRVMDDSVADVIAEMVNIIAGSAKARFKTDELRPIELSLPTVVRGSNYAVQYPSGSVWLEVPFDSELGPFSMRVTFQMKQAG